MTIQRLLVANRGEIARRVFATCRRLGIETMAVFSDPDAGLPFVAEADTAARLPGATPAETYLQGKFVVEAARAAGGEAVHPGYGFLSENSDFARAVLDGGLVWVGPPPEAIEAMGSKVRAKEIVRSAGVPVLDDVTPEAATVDDLPLLVKASAGGGGRGMRVVRSLDQLSSQVESARAEAASAFGDGTVFVEPYVEQGRHVEVQVLFDQHGQGVALGDRDCSLQRRHQKVLEEAPAPGLDEDVRRAMHEAAVAAGRAVGYTNAGTVEFLYDAGTRKFFFLEMNTRLQVEHPVTECVTGVDLVAAQIAVAEGRTLDEILPGGVPGPRGHAVEVRLYAEDPAAGWQPTAGRLARFEIPADVAFEVPSGHGIRVDAGFVTGDEVGTHYDAMLAKVISWAPDRPSALRALAGALRRAQIHGPETNRDLLVNVLRHEAFAAGDVCTDFFDRHGVETLAASPVDDTTVRLSAFAAAVALAERDARARAVQRRVPVGWRNVVSAPLSTRFVRKDEPGPRGAVSDESGLEVRWYGGRDGYRCADVDGVGLDVDVVAAGTDRVVLEHDGVRQRFAVHVTGDAVDVESSAGHLALRRAPRFVDPAEQVATGSLLAPMPGTVVSVAVGAGTEVASGEPVLVLEAMKMQHTVSAPHDGVVTELPVAVGSQVSAGDVLAVVQPASSAASPAEDPTQQGESA